MRIWHGIKRRRQEEVNDYSRTTASLTASMVSFLRSFGENQAELPSTDDYLPFRFEDPNSPKNQLKRQLSPETIAIANQLIASGQMPAKIVRYLYQVEGMQEVLEEGGR